MKAKENVTSEGFIAVFNGKNPDGWWRLGHIDSCNLEAMFTEERFALRDKDVAGPCTPDVPHRGREAGLLWPPCLP